MDYKRLEKRFDAALAKLTKEDINKWLDENKEPEVPKGWVSIEEHLPMCMAMDFVAQGYSVYRVMDKWGNEFDTRVCDHNIWYYDAKSAGITHWWNP